MKKVCTEVFYMTEIRDCIHSYLFMHVLLLTEMLKVKGKDANKSKFAMFGSAILFLCSVPSVFALF